MATKTINCYLSESSFKQAADFIRQYKQDFLKKCENLGMQLASKGYMVSRMIVNSIPYEEGGSLDVQLYQDEKNGTYEGRIVLSGEQCVFVEFGSGVYYNPSASGSFHPRGEDFGFTIDSYNPNGKANIKGWEGSNATNPKGWYTPEGQHTYGTHTYMPLERAYETMLTDLTSIARSIF